MENFTFISFAFLNIYSDNARNSILSCRYVRSDRVVILMNLCLALTVSYIIFLAGVNQTQNKVGIYDIPYFLNCYLSQTYFLI